MKFGVIAIAALMLGTSGASSQDFDIKKGEKVFKKCAACHALGEGAKNKVGPELNGILGRPVASLEDFKYSTGDDSMTAWGEGKVWDVPTLTAYLAKPKDAIKKTKMAFAGLKKEADVENVIAFLAQYDADGAMVDPAEAIKAHGGE